LKLCVPTTFEDSFLDNLNRLNAKYKRAGAQVHEIYGSLRTSITGTGRASTVLPNVDEEILSQHIRKAHSYGIEFDYTLNASCMNLIEYTDSGSREIHRLLERFSDIGVDTITIAIPYLIELVANTYPEFKINASSICYIDSLERALTYEKLGADRITLNEDVNRSFRLLKLIRSRIGVALQVIANNGGLLKCPYKSYHDNLNAHVSQIVEEDTTGFTYIPYPMMRCTLDRLTDHKEIIRAPWFRPEDSRYYTDLGIDFIKIAGRGIPSKQLSVLVEAYLSGRFEGNIYALIDNSYLHFQKNRLLDDEKTLRPLEIAIDNRSLDGWYDFFAKHNPPCITGCGSCNYCDRLALKVVKTDSKLEKEYIANINRTIKRVASADLPIQFCQKENGAWVVRRRPKTAKLTCCES
jgi:collagenase-like PrtC family protease